MCFREGRRLLLYVLLAISAAPAAGLESDRQQPLEVRADSTDGTLGDGVTVLRGNVVIRQGTLHIRAHTAEVDKLNGKVQTVTLRGDPAFLEQEIENEGQVEAEAETITYRVGTGLVNLTGSANVRHPQYEIRGEDLAYDLNVQHFRGNGGEDGDGRILIRLDPEIVETGPDGPDETQSQEDPRSPPPDDPDG